MSFTYVVDPDRLEAARAAGEAAARYVAVDPSFWLDQAALAGVRLEFLDRGGFVTNCVDADFETAVFLEGWLDGSPGAADAVEKMARERAERRVRRA